MILTYGVNLPLSQGRMYIVRFADSFKGEPSDSDAPEFLFVSGLYEGEIEKDDATWVTLTNWWSPTDMEHDIRQVSYVIRDAIVEDWDVTPTKPGINFKRENEAIDEFIAEIDEEEEAVSMNINPPAQFQKEDPGGQIPYH